MARDVPRWLDAVRSAWAHTGAARPAFAVEPGPGEESVWDYPRPPVIVADARHVVVGERTDPIADTRRAVRLLETASPPTFYLPGADVRIDRMVQTDGRSFCEWKGAARYWAVAAAPSIPVAWDYPEPFPEYAALGGHFAFYPGQVTCWVDDEEVRAQQGGFYGGWVTDEIVGPYKGEPGTGGW